MDDNNSNKYYLFTVISLITAFIAALAALVNNLSTVINAGFFLHANEYVFMFIFEMAAIVVVILLIPIIPKTSKAIYGALARYTYFKPSYSKVLIICLIAASLVAISYNTYYHSSYYQRGMSIRLNLYKRQLISEANIKHNQGAIKSSAEILRRCYTLFDSYICKQKLHAEEDMIKALDTALWVYNITPDHSLYKENSLKLISQLEVEENISRELKHELEDRIKHLENIYRDGLKAIKKEDYKEAQNIFYQLNKKHPGYMNSHMLANELQNIMMVSNVTDKHINNTIYVSAVINADTIESIIDQLKTHNNRMH